MFQQNSGICLQDFTLSDQGCKKRSEFFQLFYMRLIIICGFFHVFESLIRLFCTDIDRSLQLLFRFRLCVLLNFPAHAV